MVRKRIYYPHGGGEIPLDIAIEDGIARLPPPHRIRGPPYVRRIIEEIGHELQGM